MRCAQNQLRELSIAMLACVATVGCTEKEPPPTESVPPAVEARTPDPYEHSSSRFGDVHLHAGFNPDPRVVEGTAVGEVLASTIHRKCKGWIAEKPDYLLVADTAFLQLHVLGRSHEDVSLVVRKPDGMVVCNDNRPGTRDPMVRSDFPIGSSQIWIGVKTEGAQALYHLGFSEVKWRSSVIPLPEAN